VHNQAVWADSCAAPRCPGALSWPAGPRSQPRTQAYKSALLRNPGLLSGATVLDVGCGTGILSLFAARGGAAAVVGLDGSERIAGFARQVGRGPVAALCGWLNTLHTRCA
jgi:2-polyprenyl-3-methyl-5-hydroxy-6-metoxy-1,4-benzoquinol methylase